MGGGGSEARVTTYEATRRDGSASAQERVGPAGQRTACRCRVPLPRAAAAGKWGAGRAPPAMGCRLGKRSTAPERMPGGRADFASRAALRRGVQRCYWQLVVKLSGSATTVTPRIVAPTSTNWPLERVVARTGPMIGSRIGIVAILR